MIKKIVSRVQGRMLKSRKKLIEDMVEEGVFKKREKDGDIAYSDEFAEIVEKIRSSLINENGSANVPFYVKDILKGERNLKKAEKKAKTAVLLYAYLCFRYEKSPLAEHHFEYYAGDINEISDRLLGIMAFEEACKDGL